MSKHELNVGLFIALALIIAGMQACHQEYRLKMKCMDKGWQIQNNQCQPVDRDAH